MYFFKKKKIIVKLLMLNQLFLLLMEAQRGLKDTLVSFCLDFLLALNVVWNSFLRKSIIQCVLLVNQFFRFFNLPKTFL